MTARYKQWQLPSATRRARSQRKQTVILCNPSSQASTTQLHCRCKRIVMQRLTDAACSGTVFCSAKCRLYSRFAAGRSSPLKPYLPNSRKLHKAMGTDLTARFFHRYGHFAWYISHYIIRHPRLSSKIRTFVCIFCCEHFKLQSVIYFIDIQCAISYNKWEK